MVNNAFAGQSEPPTEGQLATKLGAAKPVWDTLLERLSEELDLRVQEWNSYSKKAGWTLRVKKGERNIVYLSPGYAEFVVSFALGDRAVTAAKAAKLPKRVMDAIAGARRYMEGTAVYLELRNTRDVAAVIKLAAIKLEN